MKRWNRRIFFNVTFVVNCKFLQDFSNPMISTESLIIFSYKNKYKLAQHMVCHEDLRSWKCKTCGQAFNYKKLLQRHIQVVYSFNSQYQRQLILFIYLLQAVHENERPFGCTFCEKRFNSKYDLTVNIESLLCLTIVNCY